MQSPRVVIRTDASMRIGTGHVMRCLTLADTLRARGAAVHFICRDHDGHLGERIADHGHGITLLPRTDDLPDSDGTAHAPWLGAPRALDAAQSIAAITATTGGSCGVLVVDHYAIDYRWQILLRPYCDRLFVIDDLADRRHDCDGLLDQNLFEDAEHRYDGLLPPAARCFIGPSFALLRDNIRDARRHVRAAAPPWQVLAFFGGTDPGGLLPRTLVATAALADLPLQWQFVGPLPEPLPTLPPNVHWCEQASDFGQMLAQAHLALGAAGSVTLERLYLGLPALIVICGDNQRAAATYLEQLGVARVLGESHDIDAAAIAAALRTQLGDCAGIARMAARTATLPIGDCTARIYAFLEGHDAPPPA